MSSDIILKVESVSKQYRLGVVGTGTLSHDLNRWWSKVRGKGDPYIKVGSINDRSKKGDSQYVWALKDINFEVKKGEVYGIIGKNGAGKSTLLKILSKVTSPSTGEIKTKGHIASLLEVGTGFHPEMTGRENIYLNGAILGMTKSEINTKIDEIIDFSGCLKYIDTPVKRYSSGMKVRLAFAVAAHLEPDILVVDEVLAVGDAEFQKKAIGKMQDISNSEGRTVLFVSHNMAAVRSLCTRGMLIENGRISSIDTIDKIIELYLDKDAVKNKINTDNRSGSGLMKVEDIIISGKKPNMSPENGALFRIEIQLESQIKISSQQLRLDLKINDYMGQRVAWLSNYLSDIKTVEEVKKIVFSIPKLNLNGGTYFISTDLYIDKKRSDFLQNAISFDINNGDFYGNGRNIPIQESRILMNFNTEILGE
ncbi:polysaccharide ABC transporter ATP-binding protein [Winogradskyella flava]|uniref:ABC transporter ATP-binding protein n=1 Tax=Winogradskyella flava TaxID=1884876 RepID=UPI002491C692|nr:ABC transporter ATP-binding protein [Winogradskyella flava]